MSIFYRKKDLLRAMKEAGLPCSDMWLRDNEHRGLMRSPVIPNSRGDRAYTKEQIDEIVKAFSPGGKGEWKP